MSQPPDKTVNPFDPMGLWRNAQDATLDSWSKAMIELVNSEQYSEATARMLDSYLSMSAPMRKLLTQTMSQALGQFNMPTQQEVLSLAERLTNIEMRLDDMDARFDDVVRRLKGIAEAQAARPTQPEPAASTPARRTTAQSRPGASRRAASKTTPTKNA